LANLELLTVFCRNLLSHLDSPVLDDMLTNAIGKLVLYLAYPNQMNDLLAYLVSRLPSHSTPLLKCIHAQFDARLSFIEMAQAGGDPVISAPISFTILLPLFSVPFDFNEKTLSNSKTNEDQQLVFLILYKALRYISFRFTSFFRLDMTDTHTYPTEQDTSFCLELQTFIGKRITFAESSLFDYAASGSLLIAICKVFGNTQVVRVVFFLFTLQDSIGCSPLNEQLSLTAKCLMTSMILHVFIELFRWLEIEDGLIWLDLLKQTKIENQEWVPQVSECPENVLNHNLVELSVTNQPITINQEQLLAYLKNNSKLKDHFDTNYLDMKSKHSCTLINFLRYSAKAVHCWKRLHSMEKDGKFSLGFKQVGCSNNCHKN
jgi:hypothetical protein